MEAYLNKGIKEIIDQYPAVEKILDEYGIGCGLCSVGLCLLKDIVEIHRLPPDQERELMARIAKAIDPEADIEILEAKAAAAAEPAEIKYSPPMKKLVDEHVLIKRWIALIPKVVEHLDVWTLTNTSRPSPPRIVVLPEMRFRATDVAPPTLLW